MEARCARATSISCNGGLPHSFFHFMLDMFAVAGSRAAVLCSFKFLGFFVIAVRSTCMNLPSLSDQVANSFEVAAAEFTNT